MKVFIIFLLCILDIYASIVTLTQNEKNFIKSHPAITLGGGISFEPFLIQNPDGTVSGYDVDIANLIEKKTGLEIRFKLDNWKKIQEEAENRLLDGISTAGKVDSRDKYYNYSYPYFTYSPLVFVNKGNPKNIHDYEDLSGKVMAVQRGNVIFTNIAKSIDNVTIIYYETMHELITNLVSKEIDFIILDETAFYLAKELGLEAFIEHSFVVGKKRDIVFCVRNDYPELVNIINKGLSAISKPELLKIRDRWMKLDNIQRFSTKLTLTEKEKKYLNEKEIIRMCIDPNWLPYTKLFNGKHIGISADINKLVASRLPIPIEMVKTKNWNESLEFVEQRKCDILDLAIETPLRKEYLNFTSPYVKAPLVIVTKFDVTFIESFTDLKGKKIAIPKGYAFVEILKKKYPFLNIIETKNIKDGLALVKDAKVFGYIGALPSVAHAFKENFTGELKVTGKFDLTFDMSAAVRNDDKILFRIMQKAFSSIPQEDINHIVTKWINIKYEAKTDYKLISYILLIVFFIMLVGLYYYKKLYTMNKKLLCLEAELRKQAHIDPLTSLFNRRYFTEIAKSLLNLAIRKKSDISILMFDIDKFKNVNDVYGHHIGDDVLKFFASTLQNSNRKSDVICRWGGEEFITLLPNTSKKKAVSLAEKIRKRIENKRIDLADGKKLKFTVSIGVSQVNNEVDLNIEAAIDRADRALYEAKNSGRNKVCFN